MRKISIVGVLVGGVVDIIVTNILMIPVFFVAAGMAGSELAGAAREQVTPIIIGVLRDHPALYAAGFVGGVLASILGGYVAARIAKRNFLLNGALSAYLCIGSGIYAMVTGAGGTIPLWQHIVFLPLSPALGALGGYIVARRHDRGEARMVEATVG